MTPTYKTPEKDRAKWMRYYARIRPTHLAVMREQMRVKRRELMNLLGPWRVVCGEKDREVLQFDHKTSLLRSTRRGDLRVLCANHHAKKTATERRSGAYVVSPNLSGGPSSPPMRYA